MAAWECQHVGYRSFELPTAATNIVPWGVLIAGEELHNNRHAFPSSPRFAVQAWEIDMGWLFICVFRALGLARVGNLAPTPYIGHDRVSVDADTVRALFANRMHVLRDLPGHLRPGLVVERFTRAVQRNHIMRSLCTTRSCLEIVNTNRQPCQLSPSAQALCGSTPTAPSPRRRGDTYRAGVAPLSASPDSYQAVGPYFWPIVRTTRISRPQGAADRSPGKLGVILRLVRVVECGDRRQLRALLR